jgi:hypothetical protein
MEVSMKLNDDILQELNAIYNNRERAAVFEGVFGNYKAGRTILLADAKEDEPFCLNNYNVVINSAREVPPELLERLSKTVRDYMSEQDEKLRQVEIGNLPFDCEDWW